MYVILRTRPPTQSLTTKGPLLGSRSMRSTSRNRNRRIIRQMDAGARVAVYWDFGDN